MKIPESKELVIFGAGLFGSRALYYFRDHGCRVLAFIDNNAKCLMGGAKSLPVIDIDTYQKDYAGVPICIATKAGNAIQIKKQLDDLGVDNYFLYDLNIDYGKERIITYCRGESEDVILYHVLHNVDDVFYIDVGCNDPFNDSVTKLFYDVKNAHGINIDPLHELMEIVKRERPRDINLEAAIGAKTEKRKIFYQGGRSTFVESNVTALAEKSAMVDIVTLASVCDKYVKRGQDIHFLKIDVEGFERDVLAGADFETYRPWVLCIESTLPNTEIPCYDTWEPIVTKAGYEFVKMYGVDRYYVAKEHQDLAQRFCDFEELEKMYMIYDAKFSVR